MLTKSRIKFDQLKKVCAELAHYLLIEHKEEIYCAKYVSLLTHIDNYLDENPRVSADAQEVLDYLIVSGIFKLKEDGKYCFRLNGIFEYFLAHYLTTHEGFKQEIINDDKIYLSFKNELEIYSGLRNDDVSFLTDIFEKTQIIFNNINSNYSSLGSSDDLLTNKVKKASQLMDVAKRFINSGPFDKETQDEMLEKHSPLMIENEIKKKELFDVQNIDSRILERYLSILARVFKNTDEVKDIDLVNKVLNFLLESYISFGFYMMDEAAENSRNYWDKNEVTDEQINILQFVSNIVPLVTQIAMFDGLGHHNVEEIIKTKIKDLSEDQEKNQYKLFILYLVLIDIDIDRNHTLIDELIGVIKKGVLKMTLLFKLNYYLSFKAFDKPQIEQYLKQKIHSIKKKIDSKIDTGTIQHDLSEKSKANIIKKTRDK